MNAFSSHLHLAHHYWSLHLKPGDNVIDATCGNGYDTLFLSQLVLENERGKVIGLDIQERAIQQTTLLLEEKLPSDLKKRVYIFQQSHVYVPPLVQEGSIRLIAYNLGYLPGGDKSLTTKTSTTIESINNYFNLLSSDGLISITCYPGHFEGATEEKALLEWVTSFSPHQWIICYHRWLNRIKSPSLILIQKINKNQLY